MVDDRDHVADTERGRRATALERNLVSRSARDFVARAIHEKDAVEVDLSIDVEAEPCGRLGRQRAADVRTRDGAARRNRRSHGRLEELPTDRGRCGGELVPVGAIVTTTIGIDLDVNTTTRGGIGPVVEQEERAGNRRVSRSRGTCKQIGVTRTTRTGQRQERLIVVKRTVDVYGSVSTGCSTVTRKEPNGGAVRSRRRGAARV